MRRYRYPGVQPFTAFQQDQFFGRAEDCERLVSLIQLEKLIVLFGKSGYGKSSLLNAGVALRLSEESKPGKRDYVPVFIRFNTWESNNRLDWYARFTFQFDQAVVLDQDLPVDRDFLPPTLWGALKRRQRHTKQVFVLIFDQFEEFFTFPEEQQREFKTQLADLLFADIPSYLELFESRHSDQEVEFMSGKLEVKAVFSLRADRLSLLDRMKDKLPAILNKRYELRGLSRQQAIEAIVRPAELEQGDKFICPPFAYSDAALDALVYELKKSGDQSASHDPERQDAYIEAFLLQICCESIERRVAERAQQEPGVAVTVQPGDLPRFDRIYEEYYLNKISELPEAQRNLAKRLIEDELISVHEPSGVAYRLNADGRKLMADTQIDESLLKRLTDCFLLRSEPNTTGGFNYEISHDTLVKPVLQAKEARLAEERRSEEARAEVLRRAELQVERRKRQRATAIAVLGMLLTAISIVAFVYALQARNTARAAEYRAISERNKALQAQEVAEARLQALQKEQAAARIAKGDGLQFYGQTAAALFEYQEALKLTPNDAALQQKIAACLTLLKKR